MNGFLYTLTLNEPVLANSLGGEPNSADSLSYVPGGAVRGAFIQAYDQAKDAADDDFRRLFLTGDTCYLNAYPLLDGERSLPIPLKYKKPKYFESSDFGKIGDKVIALKVISQVNIHTQRDAEKGHATSEAGAVYRYIALPAGMKLQGAVLTQNETDARMLKNMLNGTSILLGKARTAGYGRATFQTQDINPKWRECGGELAATPGTFNLTLLSSMIVRDENGQVSLELKQALETRLGVKVEIIETIRRAVNIGGFNRTWGLPLPQVAAIAAGSMFVFKADVSAEKLFQLEATGLGERRAEGFGRVAVNLSLPDVLDWVAVEENISPALNGTLPQGDALATLMLTRLLRRDLDEQVIRVARTLTCDYKGGLPNSQLSRWRIILRDAMPAKDIQRVSEFCEKAKGKPGWKKMEKTRLFLEGEKPPRLTEWIESVLAGDKDWQAIWNAHFKLAKKIGSVSISADEFADEYRLRLMDAVLAILSKQNKEEGGANG